MNLKEQRYVCTLAKSGSLLVASTQLYISQPALSLYISNLEQNLGYPLFERVGKRFVLTKAGEIYVNKAQQMLDLNQSYELEISSLEKGYHECLRVGFQDIRSNVMSSILIKEFCEKFPNVDLLWYEGNYMQLQQWLDTNQIDLFFCNCPFLKSEYAYTLICHDRMLFAVNRNHPVLRNIPILDKANPHIDLKLFKNDRFILQMESQSLYQFVDQIFKKANFQPKNVFRIRKIATMIGLINDDFGVGFCPEGYIKLMRNTENIMVFNVTTSPKIIDFNAVYRKGAKLHEGALFLIELTRKIV